MCINQSRIAHEHLTVFDFAFRLLSLELCKTKYNISYEENESLTIILSAVLERELIKGIRLAQCCHTVWLLCKDNKEMI